MKVEKRVCAWCGKPMRGMASITIGFGKTCWYCHADERPSCYEKAQRQGSFVRKGRWSA